MRSCFSSEMSLNEGLEDGSRSQTCVNKMGQRGAAEARLG